MNTAACASRRMPICGNGKLGPQLQVLYPRLEIDLVLTDHPVDLVEQSIDVAVRIGRLADSSLIGVSLGIMLTVVVASPGYISRHGTAKTPEDVQRHHFVLHAGQLQTAKLTLSGPKGRTVAIPCRSRFTVSSILGVREAVMAGAGLNAGPLWLYADAIDRGELVRVCQPGTRRGIQLTRSCYQADIDPQRPIARSPCCE